MEKVTADKIRETLQRVTRVETRLVTLGKKMGHDLTEEEEIKVERRMDPRDETKQYPVVTIPSLDIPLSTIMKACRRADAWGAVPVLGPNGLIGTLVVSREG